MAEYTPETLKAMLARNIAASQGKGFDGQEHPEYRGIAQTVLNALYPLTPEIICKIMNSEGGIYTLRIEASNLAVNRK
jgi:hypothetical protein